MAEGKPDGLVAVEIFAQKASDHLFDSTPSCSVTLTVYDKRGIPPDSSSGQ